MTTTEAKQEGALLPCPFCGGEVHHMHGNENWPEQIICMGCGVGMHAHRGQPSILVNRWNRRATPAPDARQEDGAVGMPNPETLMRNAIERDATRKQAPPPTLRECSDAVADEIEARHPGMKIVRALEGDEHALLLVLMQAWLGLKKLGWRDFIYCPRDGSPQQFLEMGSTGIHDGYRDEEGRVWLGPDGSPSHPYLFRTVAALAAEDKSRE
jgi:Lar family restriction alleviation protein